MLTVYTWRKLELHIWIKIQDYIAEYGDCLYQLDNHRNVQDKKYNKLLIYKKDLWNFLKEYMDNEDMIKYLKEYVYNKPQAESWFQMDKLDKDFFTEDYWNDDFNLDERIHLDDLVDLVTEVSWDEINMDLIFIV